MITHRLNSVQSLCFQGLPSILRPHSNHEDNKMQKTPITLPTVRLVLGIIAIILSLIFSIQFVSQGNTGGAVIAAILWCAITEFAKVTFTHDCMVYFETNQGSKALFSAMIVMILFALSISAAVFVLTIAPAKNDMVIAQSDSKIASLETAISDKKTQLAACPPNYMKNCRTPLNAELAELQSELSAVLSQSDNAVVIDAKANAEFWKKAADYLGTNPNSLQINFAIARAVLLDLIGLILISQYTAARRINSDIKAGFTQENSGINQLLSNDNQALKAEIEALKLELKSKTETEKKD